MEFLESLTIVRNLSGLVLIEPSAAVKTILSRDLYIHLKKDPSSSSHCRWKTRNQESQQCVSNK